MLDVVKQKERKRKTGRTKARPTAIEWANGRRKKKLARKRTQNGAEKGVAEDEDQRGRSRSKALESDNAYP